MIPKYANFTLLNENLQKARKVLRDLKVAETDPNFIKLRQLLSRNTGYLGKFTEWMYVNKISYTQLENLFNRIKNTRLPKQIDTYNSPEEIIDSLVRGGADAAVNQMVGAIPSRTRDDLKGEDCDECSGLGEVDCETCDGNGEITCDKCDGDGSLYDEKGELISCDKCLKEVKARRKNGVYPPPKYEPSGVIKCSKCEKGGNKCISCEGTGKKESEEWGAFKSFLALHQDKKDVIIDFLSKKGGRYSTDDYYGDYDTPLDRLTDDISKLLNMPSIEDIKNESLVKSKNPNVSFIYDDEKYLIIAVNYNGIKKYGSSYWCIHDDEGTFDSYVSENDEKNIQLILYVKGKAPLVDEKSVMGITINYNKEISAAHWEDDDDCQDLADEIINGPRYSIGPNGRRRASKERVTLPIDSRNILNAYKTLYGYSEDDLNGLRFEVKEIYQDEIDNAIEMLSKDMPSKSTNKKAKNTSSSLDRVTIFCTNLLRDFLSYCSDRGIDNEDIVGLDFLKYFEKRVKEVNIKIPIDIGDVIGLSLFDICLYDKRWQNINIFSEIEDVGLSTSRDTDEIISIIKFLMENGYDIKRFMDEESAIYTEILISAGILKFSDYYKQIYSNKLIEKNIGWILENDFDHIHATNDLATIAIKYMNKKGLIDKYKDKLLVLINSGKFNTHNCDYIAHEVDDTDISIAAARRILPPKLLKKFKFEISKLEHLKGFEEFKRLL